MESKLYYDVMYDRQDLYLWDVAGSQKTYYVAGPDGNMTGRTGRTVGRHIG